MTAASMTQSLLKIDFLRDEDLFLECLTAMYSGFVMTRNPVYSRADVLSLLVNALHSCSRLRLQQTILIILAEFCSPSTHYDAHYVKRHLINNNITKLLCLWLKETLPGELTLSELSSHLLRHLADTLLPAELQLVLQTLLPTTMAICNVQKSEHFSYDTTIRVMLENLMLGKNLVQETAACLVPGSGRPTGPILDLFGFSNLQLLHCIGDVFDTSSELEDVSMVEVLSKRGLVWKEPSSTVSAQECPAWRDIVPSQIIGGPHFLAHDQDNMMQILDIEQIMNEQNYPALTVCPEPGDVVTARSILESRWSRLSGKINYRAQVCRREHDSYTVLALDYGLIVRVDRAQLFQPCPMLLHMRPTALLCSLPGIQPSPRSQVTLRNCLAILQSLTVGNFMVCEAICKDPGTFSVLLRLAFVVPEESIAVQVLNILLHMAYSSSVRSQMSGADCLDKLIKLLGQFATSEWKTALIRTLSAISCILFQNSLAAQRLTMILGLHAVARCLVAFPDDLAVNAVVMQTFSNYLGDINLVKYTQGQWLSSERELLRNRTATNLDADKKADVFRTPSPSAFTFSLSEPTGHQSQRGEPIGRHTQRGEPIGHLIQTGEARGRCQRLELHPRAQAVTGLTARRSKSLSSSDDESSVSHKMDSARIGLHYMSISLQSQARRSSRTFYRKNESTGLVKSYDCELIERSVNLDVQTIKRTVAGFLNSGIDGRILYGVQCDGKVSGVYINRYQRDSMRLSIDRICSDFQPRLLHSHIILHLYPVCAEAMADVPAVRTFIPDLYMAEIAVAGRSNVVEAYVIEPEEVYLRVGTQTVLASAQDLREMLTTRMEATRGLIS